MKQKLQKAKALVVKGDVKGALDILKSLSESIKGRMAACPGCGAESVTIEKQDSECGECSKCGAVWGKKLVKGEIMSDKLNKKEILSQLWEMYRKGDQDADAFSINRFDLTGWLKKSLADKLNKVSLLNPDQQAVLSGEKKGLQTLTSGQAAMLEPKKEEPKKEDAEKCTKCDLVKDMCKCIDKAIPPAIQAKIDAKKTVKKSEEESLSKENVLDVMLQMVKAGEEKTLVNHLSVTKFENTNEISEMVLKAVYKKAGRDFYALTKKKEDKRGRDEVPAGELKDQMEAADEHTGPVKPKIEKGDAQPGYDVAPDAESIARKRFIGGLKPHMDKIPHSEKDLNDMPLPQLRDLHDKHNPVVISIPRETGPGGPSGTIAGVKHTKVVFDGSKKK